MVQRFIIAAVARLGSEQSMGIPGFRTRRGAAWCDAARRGATRHGMAQHGAVRQLESGFWTHMRVEKHVDRTSAPDYGRVGILSHPISMTIARFPCSLQRPGALQPTSERPLDSGMLLNSHMRPQSGGSLSRPPPAP